MGFEKIIGRILKAEGGFTDHPDDKGGPTNFGITLSTLAAFRGRPASRSDVQNLTLDEAILIYKKKYWDPMQLDRFTDEGVQLVLFDQGVNRGTVTAAKQAQRVATALGFKLTEDGDLGSISASKINSINPIVFAREYLQASEHAYVDIVKRNPSQIVFLRGWLNRVHALQDVIFNGQSSTAVIPVVEKLPDAEKPAEEKKPLPGVPVIPAVPSWLQRAYLYAGKKEQDAAFNRFLSGFWRIVGLGLKTISGRSAAWCGLFVAVMLNLSGLTWQKDGAAARNWRKFGVAIDYEKQGIPMGAVVWIDHGRDGKQERCVGDGNHVTFADGDCTVEDLKKSGQFPGFGGNQGDTAKRSMYPANDICAVRWPDKDQAGKPIPLPQLPIKKSRNCSGSKSPSEKTTLRSAHKLGIAA